MSEFEEQNREALAEWERYKQEFRENRSDPHELPMVFSEWKERVWEPLQADPLAQALSNVPQDLRQQEEFVRKRLPEAFLRSRHLEDERNRKATGEPSQSFEQFCGGLQQEMADDPEAMRREFVEAVPGYDDAVAQVQGQVAEREGEAARQALKDLRPIRGLMDVLDSKAQQGVAGAVREAAFDADPTQNATTKVVRSLAENAPDEFLDPDVIDKLPEEVQEKVFTRENRPTPEQERLEAMSLDELDNLMEENEELAWEAMHGPAPKPATAPSKPVADMSLDELDALLDGAHE